MRKFARTHWKILIAILLAIVLATLTLETDSAAPASPPDLSARLRAHVEAIASEEHNTATPRALAGAARHIETTLAGYGYRPQRQEYRAGKQKVRNIEVSVSSVAPGMKPERIFIVGAHYDSARGAPGANDNGSGTAAVLELARLLKGMQPSRGTEIKFVFFVNEERPSQLENAKGEEMGSMQHARALRDSGANVAGAPILETVGWYSEAPGSRKLPPGLENQYPSTGNFIAFAGTLESSAQVAQALAAFRAQPDFPAQGLAAPAHVMGVTLSDHSSYNRHGYPALMITDTAFLRYPYYETAEDTPDKPDYASMARVVKGLARTIDSLAGAAQT